MELTAAVDDRGASLFLAGTLDAEGVDKLSPWIRSKPTTLNLQNVRNITPLGLRRWIELLSRSSQLTVEALSYEFTRRARGVADLFGAASVQSFMAPYYCPTCCMERHARLGTHEIQKDIRPSRTCPCCGDTMEFDELEDFFDFVQPQYGRPRTDDST